VASSGRLLEAVGRGTPTTEPITLTHVDTLANASRPAPSRWPPTTFQAETVVLNIDHLPIGVF
jgi:hypothetical protein